MAQPNYSVYDLPLALPSKIVDIQGRELYSFFNEKRTPVDYKDISPIMVQAMISTEDKNYWNNDGFDPRGMIRSAAVTLRDWRDNGFLGYSQGASTLTQQIIKNTIGGKEKKIERKVHEIIQAWLLTYRSYDINKQFFKNDNAKVWQKTKEDIITYYLNSSFFGNNAYGIREASRIYFDKTPKELNLLESTILASIPKSPYYFNPYKYPDNILGNWQISIDGEKAIPIDTQQYGYLFHDLVTNISTGIMTDNRILTLLPSFSGSTLGEDGRHHRWNISYDPGRKDYVLQRLREDGHISLQQAIETMLQYYTFQEKPQLNTIQAPHFVYYIKNEVLGLDGLEMNEQTLAQGGYTIMTTLNLDTQKELERIVTVHNDDAYKLGATNRSVLVTNMHDGSIIGYVGSKDFYNTNVDGQVDLIQQPRQVGSALKPLIYAYGFMNYPFGLDTIIRDTKTNFGGYIPKNADGVYKGNTRLKNVLAGSRNIPAIKLFNALGGVKTFVPFFQRLGMKNLDSDGKYGLSMALGTAPMSMIDLAQGYLHLSDGDSVGMVHGVSKIVDRQGFVVYDYADTMLERQYPLGVARLITYILQTTSFFPGYMKDTVSFPGCISCASKTGTTNMKVNGKSVARDGWLVTYNPDILTVLRAGNTDASPLNRNAYGYLLNTKLRNDIFWFLKEQGYTLEDADRKYPTDQTVVRKGHGEGYITPIHEYIPQSVKNKL